jgi:cytochrome P450
MGVSFILLEPSVHANTSSTITNVVPSSTTMTLQAWRDESIIADLRANLRPFIHPTINIKQLEKQPLLQSLYAETLRFSVQILIPRCSPHQPLTVGSGRSTAHIPHDKFILMNTWLAHMDEKTWNTWNGAHPLPDLRAQRFLVDGSDPASGPTRPGVLNERVDAPPNQHVFFSTEGLEGAWIPYGGESYRRASIRMAWRLRRRLAKQPFANELGVLGGQHACPGRLLAKRVVLLSCAVLTTLYDVEILATEEDLEFVLPWFGFGVRKPKGKIPFRIRMRDPSKELP